MNLNVEVGPRHVFNAGVKELGAELVHNDLQTNRGAVKLPYSGELLQGKTPQSQRSIRHEIGLDLGQDYHGGGGGVAKTETETQQVQFRNSPIGKPLHNFPAIPQGVVTPTMRLVVFKVEFVCLFGITFEVGGDAGVDQGRKWRESDKSHKFTSIPCCSTPDFTTDSIQ